MTNELNDKLKIVDELKSKLKTLKDLEDTIDKFTEMKDRVRSEVLELMRRENLRQYKNEIATISQVVSKKIVTSRTPEEIVAELKEKKLVKYLTTIPEQVIHSHEVVNALYQEDLKSGTLELDGVTITETITPQIRFIK
jgi:hypothetical protein